METKIMVLVRFVNFDVTLTNVLPLQPHLRFFKTFSLCPENQVFASVLHFLIFSWQIMVIAIKVHGPILQS